jgi:hypothetical protein
MLLREAIPLCTNPDNSPKPVTLGAQAPKPPVHFDIFRLRAGSNLETKIRLLLSIDGFVKTCH